MQVVCFLLFTVKRPFFSSQSCFLDLSLLLFSHRRNVASIRHPRISQFGCWEWIALFAWNRIGEICEWFWNLPCLGTGLGFSSGGIVAAYCDFLLRELKLFLVWIWNFFSVFWLRFGDFFFLTRVYEYLVADFGVEAWSLVLPACPWVSARLLT